MSPADADARAREVEARMTDDERFALLVSVMGAGEMWPVRDERIPADAPMSAGYVPGVPRLGVPALLMSDAGLGVTNPGFRPGDTATALPAGLALAASFNPFLARAAGEVIGREARSRGFNVQLAGAMNLARDPRNGRNFEYHSEDPLLTATMAAESIDGIQRQGVISTVKHYSLNCNETNRHFLDAIIDPDAHRESDLLAFELAIERSQPGAVMTAYNKVNGDYAAANTVLINEVLKGAWGYRGLGDVGLGCHAELASAPWPASIRSAGPRSTRCYGRPRSFGAPLRDAYADGRLTKERLSDMVRRILRSMFAVGVDDAEAAPTPDWPAHNEIALQHRAAGNGAADQPRDVAVGARVGRAHRGHRRVCACGCTGRIRFQHRRSAGRICGCGPDRRHGPGGRAAQSVPAAVESPGRVAKAAATRPDRVRSRHQPGRGGARGAPGRHRDRVRGPRGGRGLRHRRPLAAVGPGRS